MNAIIRLVKKDKKCHEQNARLIILKVEQNIYCVIYFIAFMAMWIYSKCRNIADQLKFVKKTPKIWKYITGKDVMETERIHRRN